MHVVIHGRNHSSWRRPRDAFTHNGQNRARYTSPHGVRGRPVRLSTVIRGLPYRPASVISSTAAPVMPVAVEMLSRSASFTAVVSTAPR